MTAPQETWSAYTGAVLGKNDVALPKLWQRLHDNAVQWSLLCGVAGQGKNLAALDAIDLGLLELLKTVSASQWQGLCAGAGYTQMGAVGLSWCEGVKTADVLGMWRTTNVPLRPEPVFVRPARLLNPELLGTETRLSNILNAVDRDVFLACLRCARAGADLVVDVPEAQVPLVPREVVDFITGAMTAGLVPAASAAVFTRAPQPPGATLAPGRANWGG